MPIFWRRSARGKGRPLGEAVGALVDASLRHHARDPALTDALERIEEELPMDAETDALKADMTTLVSGVLERYGVEHPHRTAFDLIAMCHGMVHAALRADETDLADLSPSHDARRARLPRRRRTGSCLTEKSHQLYHRGTVGWNGLGVPHGLFSGLWNSGEARFRP